MTEELKHFDAIWREFQQLDAQAQGRLLTWLNSIAAENARKENPPPARPVNPAHLPTATGGPSIR